MLAMSSNVYHAALATFTCAVQDALGEVYVMPSFAAQATITEAFDAGLSAQYTAERVRRLRASVA